MKKEKTIKMKDPSKIQAIRNYKGYIAEIKKIHLSIEEAKENNDIERKKMLENLLRSKEIKVQKIDNAFTLLSEMDKDILLGYYTEGKSLYELALKYNFSRVYMCTYKGKILRRIEDLL